MEQPQAGAVNSSGNAEDSEEQLEDAAYSLTALYLSTLPAEDAQALMSYVSPTEQDHLGERLRLISEAKNLPSASICSPAVEEAEDGDVGPSLAAEYIHSLPAGEAAALLQGAPAHVRDRINEKLALFERERGIDMHDTSTSLSALYLNSLPPDQADALLAGVPTQVQVLVNRQLDSYKASTSDPTSLPFREVDPASAYPFSGFKIPCQRSETEARFARPAATLRCSGGPALIPCAACSNRLLGGRCTDCGSPGSVPLPLLSIREALVQGEAHMGEARMGEACMGEVLVEGRVELRGENLADLCSSRCSLPLPALPEMEASAVREARMETSVEGEAAEHSQAQGEIADDCCGVGEEQDGKASDAVTPLEAGSSGCQGAGNGFFMEPAAQRIEENGRQRAESAALATAEHAEESADVAALPTAEYANGPTETAAQLIVDLADRTTEAAQQTAVKDEESAEPATQPAANRAEELVEAAEQLATEHAEESAATAAQPTTRHAEQAAAAAAQLAAEQAEEMSEAAARPSEGFSEASSDTAARPTAEHAEGSPDTAAWPTAEDTEDTADTAARPTAEYAEDSVDTAVRPTAGNAEHEKADAVTTDAETSPLRTTASAVDEQAAAASQGSLSRRPILFRGGKKTSSTASPMLRHILSASNHAMAVPLAPAAPEATHAGPSGSNPAPAAGGQGPDNGGSVAAAGWQSPDEPPVARSPRSQQNLLVAQRMLEDLRSMSRERGALAPSPFAAAPAQQAVQPPVLEEQVLAARKLVSELHALHLQGSGSLDSRSRSEGGALEVGARLDARPPPPPQQQQRLGKSSSERGDGAESPSYLSSAPVPWELRELPSREGSRGPAPSVTEPAADRPGYREARGSVAPGPGEMWGEQVDSSDMASGPDSGGPGLAPSASEELEDGFEGGFDSSQTLLLSHLLLADASTECEEVVDRPPSLMGILATPSNLATPSTATTLPLRHSENENFTFSSGPPSRSSSTSLAPDLAAKLHEPQFSKLRVSIPDPDASSSSPSSGAMEAAIRKVEALRQQQQLRRAATGSAGGSASSDDAAFSAARQSPPANRFQSASAAQQVPQKFESLPLEQLRNQAMGALLASNQFQSHGSMGSLAGLSRERASSVYVQPSATSSPSRSDLLKELEALRQQWQQQQLELQQQQEQQQMQQQEQLQQQQLQQWQQLQQQQQQPWPSQQQLEQQQMQQWQEQQQLQPLQSQQQLQQQQWQQQGSISPAPAVQPALQQLPATDLVMDLEALRLLRIQQQATEALRTSREFTSGSPGGSVGGGRLQLWPSHSSEAEYGTGHISLPLNIPSSPGMSGLYSVPHTQLGGLLPVQQVQAPQMDSPVSRAQALLNGNSFSSACGLSGAAWAAGDGGGSIVTGQAALGFVPAKRLSGSGQQRPWSSRDI